MRSGLWDYGCYGGHVISLGWSVLAIPPNWMLKNGLRSNPWQIFVPTVLHCTNFDQPVLILGQSSANMLPHSLDLRLERARNGTSVLRVLKRLCQVEGIVVEWCGMVDSYDYWTKEKSHWTRSGLSRWWWVLWRCRLQRYHRSEPVVTSRRPYGKSGVKALLQKTPTL